MTGFVTGIGGRGRLPWRQGQKPKEQEHHDFEDNDDRGPSAGGVAGAADGADGAGRAGGGADGGGARAGRSGRAGCRDGHGPRGADGGCGGQVPRLGLPLGRGGGGCRHQCPCGGHGRGSAPRRPPRQRRDRARHRAGYAAGRGGDRRGPGPRRRAAARAGARGRPCRAWPRGLCSGGTPRDRVHPDRGNDLGRGPAGADRSAAVPGAA